MINKYCIGEFNGSRLYRCRLDLAYIIDYTNQWWYLKNGWRQRLSYYWVLIGSLICRVDWHNNGWPWMAVSRIARYLYGSWASCFKCCSGVARNYVYWRQTRAPEARGSRQRRRRVGWALGGVSPPQPTRGSGERRELSQWGPGQSLGRKRIFCIF